MIKYIVEQKEYNDKNYGNVYFACRVIDTEGKEVLRLPFQYGYGSHCQTLVAKALTKYRLTDPINVSFRIVLSPIV